MPEATIFDLFNLTFSKEISEHDCPSTVEKEFIETPDVFASNITMFKVSSLLQVVIIFSALDPFRTNVFVPFKTNFESKVVVGFR